VREEQQAEHDLLSLIPKRLFGRFSGTYRKISTATLQIRYLHGEKGEHVRFLVIPDTQKVTAGLGIQVFLPGALR
jgi:hypothetical protein